VAYKLIIVGGGRMGSALAEGLVDAQWCPPNELAVVETSVEQRDALAERLPGVAVIASLEIEHVDQTSGVVICVKPSTLKPWREWRRAGATRLLSVVAGLSTARIEVTLPLPIAVIRSMPNTPVLVRKGVSAIAGGAHVTKDDLDWAESILGALARSSA